MSWLVKAPQTQDALSRRFRERISEGPIWVLPGVYDGLSGLLARQTGFDGLYLSGAAYAASRGLPDLGLMNSTEVSERAAEIVNAARTPLLVDIDTGYGGVLNVARAGREMVKAGVAAVQIEDQHLPKKCGHLNGKRLVSADQMVEKIRVLRETAPTLSIVARTDARGVEGLESAWDRANRYAAAGADAIFVEALESVEEFRHTARQVTAPLLANMTEFGRTPYLTVDEFASLGYRLLIFPVSALRVAAHAMETFYRALQSEGTQRGWLERMQTREDLYALLRYDDYEALDQTIARSVLPSTPEG